MGTTKRSDTFSPASSGRVVIFATASRAVLACSVHMPGTPLFRAMSRSNASASRTSPMTSRSGRMRRASLTRRRSGTSPVPSRLAGRVCSATWSRTGRRSSQTSSAEMTRSDPGIDPARAFSIVVLPAWVWPETSTFSPDRTAASRNVAAWAVSEPSRTMSASDRARTTCLRMFTAHAERVMSGITTCRRSPPGSRASTKGLDRSSRRPEVLSIRSTRSRTCSSVSTVLVSSDTPRRATYTWVGALSQTSSISGSSRYGCNGPNPPTASVTARAAASGSSSGGTTPTLARVA